MKTLFSVLAFALSLILVPRGSATIFTNPTGLAFPDSSSPAMGTTNQTLVVSGLAGTMTGVKVIITGLSHVFPDDLDFLLVGPGGQNLEFWSDAGGSSPISGVTITVADSGATALPDTTGPVSGTTYKPADYSTLELSGNWVGLPAMTINHSTTNGSATFASVFNGLSGNGTWTLWVKDDSGGDVGSLTSWSLDISVPAGNNVGDKVFEDLDGDGIQDAGEPGVDGVTVQLLNSGNSVIATTTTSGGGAYNFAAVVDGTYSVKFIIPGGFNYSFTLQDQGGNDTLDSDPNPGTGQTAQFAVAGVSITTIDAGLKGTKISDKIFGDLNSNGIQDAGDTGIDGITVTLLNSPALTTAATTTTAGGGLYSFTNVTPGNYVIQFALPGGFGFSPKDQGGNDTLDSDVNTGTGRTDQFAIALGQTDTTRDAGMVGVGAGPFTFQGSGFAIPDGISLPRTLSIGGLPGTITDVKVILTGLSHTDPDDLDFLLVGPNGTANLEFWSDAGGPTDLSGATITVADSGASALLDAGPLVSGTTYKPADYSTVETDANFTSSTGGINHPATNGAATFASAFTNLSANGIWKLYATDDTASDTGSATGWNLVITVLVLPTTATVGGNQTICPGSTTAGLGGNTPSVGTGTWTVRSGGTGTFNPNAGTPNATFTHTSGAGPVVLRWTIAHPPAPDSFAELTVTIASPPATPTITPTPSSVCPNSPGNQASGPSGATTYSWTISNGTVTSATNIQTITYTAGASGNVGLTLRVSNASGCFATNSANVAINALPVTPTITPTPSSVTANSTGNQASGPAGATTYSWTISNGTVTSATNIQTISYTAGASGNVGLTLRVSNASGCFATNSANVPINLPPVITSTNNATFTAGVNGVFTVTRTGTPTPDLSVSGTIPNNIGFNLGTGNLSGTPLTGTGGTYPLVITATNAAGTNVQNFTLTVLESPTLICPPNVTTNAAGQCPQTVAFSATITRGYPTPTVTYKLGTNVITSPYAFPVGTNVVTVTATNGVPTAKTCSFNVTVLPGAQQPLLTIFPSGTNVVLCWSNVFSCYALQYTTQLLSPPSSNVWTVHPGPLVPGGGNLYVTNAIGATNRFFRLAAASALASCTTAPTGLVSWWRAESNATDVVSANNGTLQNGATFAAGEVGTAFSFDGLDDAVTVGNVAGLADGNTPHTIETWVKVSAYPAGRAWPLLLGNVGTGSHHWLLHPGGATQIGVWDGGQLGPNLPVGVWVHLAASFDGATLRVYTNGVSAGSVAATFNLQGKPLTVAQGQTGENFFAGLFDELSIYNRALSDSEISAIYNAGNSGKCGGQ